MLTVTEPPASAVRWLMKQFEATLAKYSEGEIGPWNMGLEIQDMILLKDDLEGHGWPKCWACGWTGPEMPLFPLYPIYADGLLRAFTVTPHLQRGLPPV